MNPSYDAQRNEFCAYVLPESETPYGMLLGNFKSYAQSTAKGGVRGLWDADLDQIIFGTHQIAYRLRDMDKTLFPHQITREFTFLPYAQISEFTLDHRLHVTEAFYVPHGPQFDRTVSFVVDITFYNPGTTQLDVAVFPWALLVGQRFYGESEHEVEAWSDERFICSKNCETGAERWWGGSQEPVAVELSLRETVLLENMRSGTLLPASDPAFDDFGKKSESSENLHGRRIFGGLEYHLSIAAGSRESLRLAVVFHKDGTAKSRPVLEALLSDSRALHDTQKYFADAMADARFMTPSPVISRGVVWAKANMLRIVKEYPHGWGSTNSPPSDILVSRDTSWFVHGFDYFWPKFSRDAIEVFNDSVDDSGLMIEYVRGVSGFKTAYDLNINDDTPLHIIAMLHHYNATLDDDWVRLCMPLIVKITDYMLTQRDDQGLLVSRAKGVDMYGISSWRNIIPYYTLDGAVTEINAEGVFALEAAAMLCAVAGDSPNWERYSNEAQSLREAMMDHLFNDDTGAFALNYDQDKNYQDSFTADEIFPVLFNVANDDQRRSILERLHEDDFITPVGLRTISTADSWYFPSYGFGLLGGVWPDLTLWYVVALARNGMTDRAVALLDAIYRTMEAGSARNTVPGEFAEWFDGGSLSNRGMYLSPWTGAKYLWAVAETIGGLNGYRTSGRPHLVPIRPEGWNWMAAARVHWGGKRCTYVIDFERNAIYGDMPELSAEDQYACIYAGRDVSDEVIVSPAEVGALAFEDDLGAVRIFVCNMMDKPRNVLVEFRGHTSRIEMLAGGLKEIQPLGKASDRHARATKPDAPVIKNDPLSSIKKAVIRMTGG